MRCAHFLKIEGGDGPMTQSDREQRIHEKAYQLWVEEGRPEGRADMHWDMATELVAIEKILLTLKPVGESSMLSPTGEPIEPLLAVENAGEFPTLADQGEETAYPKPPKPAPARFK
jgi:hypothetical protein